MKRLTQEEFINRANTLHDNKYNYAKLEYHGMTQMITVTCPTHGDFSVQANNHVKVTKHENHNPSGCPNCGRLSVIKRNKSGRLTKEEFVKKAREFHGNKYGYPGEYTGFRHQINIICPTHGLFSQQGGNHLRGTGCPKCKSSRGQSLIAATLASLNVKFMPEWSFMDCINPKTKYHLKFDFYLPTLNTIIEYDGEQHFKPTKFHQNMSTEKQQSLLEKTQFRDSIKNEYCIKQNITILRIPYTSMNQIAEILGKALKPADQ